MVEADSDDDREAIVLSDRGRGSTPVRNDTRESGGRDGGERGKGSGTDRMGKERAADSEGEEILGEEVRKRMAEKGRKRHRKVEKEWRMVVEGKGKGKWKEAMRL